MMTTESLERAVRQMRIARHLGKISASVQRRIWRRIAQPESAVRWEHMMALRASIEKEITPKLLAKREAEFDILDIKYVQPVERIKGFVPAREENTEAAAQWWREQDIKEREERKAATRARREAEKAEKKAAKAAKKAAKLAIA